MSRQRFQKYKIGQWVVTLSYVSTKSQEIDILTKVLHKLGFVLCASKLRMIDIY